MPKFSKTNVNNYHIYTLKEYNSKQVFEIYLTEKGYNEEGKKQILETFDELYTIYKQG